MHTLNFSKFLILVIALLFVPQTVGQNTVAREFAIPPLRMTIESLDEALNPMRDLVAKANSTSSSEFRSRESITLSHAGDIVKLDSWERLSDEPNIPRYISSVRYYYSASSDSAVSAVSITLQHSYRTASVEGSDANQVQSVYGFLEKSFSKHRNALASNFLKWTGALVLMFVGIILAYVRRGADRPIFSINALGILFLVSPLILPWDKWLPAVAIFSDSSSYLERYASQITLLGTLASIIGTAVAMYALFRNAEPRPVE